MNIEEFLHFRDKCFFCHEELTIFPEVGGGASDPKFTLEENGYLKICSRFINMSINMKNGDVQVPDKIGTDLHLFLQNQYIKFYKSCFTCAGTNHRYECEGKFNFDPINMITKDPTIIEIVIISNKFILTQDLNNKMSHIRFIDPTNQKSVKLPFTLPSLDLSLLTPETLERKLKIYTLFS